MDFTRFKFALPATLVVSTFVSASACRDDQVHCIDIEKQNKCEAEPICEWDAANGTCENICYTFDSQSECEAVDGCFWEGGGGSGGTGETDGPEGTCHEPFT